jgi:hypothetical protein
MWPYLNNGRVAVGYDRGVKCSPSAVVVVNDDRGAESRHRTSEKVFADLSRISGAPAQKNVTRGDDRIATRERYESTRSCPTQSPVIEQKCEGLVKAKLELYRKLAAASRMEMLSKATTKAESSKPLSSPPEVNEKSTSWNKAQSSPTRAVAKKNDEVSVTQGSTCSSTCSKKRAMPFDATAPSTFKMRKTTAKIQWDSMCNKAKAYVEKNGDISGISKDKKYEELAQWIEVERARVLYSDDLYLHSCLAKLVEAGVISLNDLAQFFERQVENAKTREKSRDDFWNENFLMLVHHTLKSGSARIPYDMQHKQLNRWASYQRQKMIKKQRGARFPTLNQGQTDLLNCLGFDWGQLSHSMG